MQPLSSMVPALRRYFTARLGADEEVNLEGPQRIAIGHSRAMLGVAVEQTKRQAIMPANKLNRIVCIRIRIKEHYRGA